MLKQSLTISRSLKLMSAPVARVFPLDLPSHPLPLVEWRPNAGAPGNYRLSLGHSRGCAINQPDYLSPSSDDLIMWSLNKPIENQKSVWGPGSLLAEN